MKERPIIFSTEMVRAILEGRKTQTRRVIKPQPEFTVEGKLNTDQATINKFIEHFLPKCPYGQVGDRLWVREKYALQRNIMVGSGFDILYWATANDFVKNHYRGNWKPSIHMPRGASRILLEITDIRVERLQEITPEDAIAEGAEYMPNATPREQRLTASQIVFAGLWDSLNAKRGYGWETNPWVWVISFKELKGENI